jgi:16S rRNA U516 pseudouridylate synthase RsuA-like enzyme
MVRKVGNQVTRLQRDRFAGIKLGNLAPGKWRYLSPGEKKTLLGDIG